MFNVQKLVSGVAESAKAVADKAKNVVTKNSDIKSTAQKVLNGPKLSGLDALASAKKPMVKSVNAAKKVAQTIEDKGVLDDVEKYSRNLRSADYINYYDYDVRKLLGLPQGYKSAADSAEWIKAKYAFEEMIEPGLSHKSAKESAAAIEVLKANQQIERANKLKAKYGDELPQFRLKKQQATLKAQLKAKHADKLVK